MKYIAQRKIFRSAPRTEQSIVITEVTEDRVRGTEVVCYRSSFGVHIPPNQTPKPFDVKRQPGNRFFKGSGSGKISYFLKEVE